MTYIYMLKSSPFLSHKGENFEYQRPYDPALPVICMAEAPRQLIREMRTPIPAQPGQTERHDYEIACNTVLEQIMQNRVETGIAQCNR